MYNTDAKFGFWYSEYTVVALLVVGGNNTTLFNIQQQSMRKQKALAAAHAATSKYVGISYDASKQVMFFKYKIWQRRLSFPLRNTSLQWFN